jgi:hypothetical protein
MLLKSISRAYVCGSDCKNVIPLILTTGSMIYLQILCKGSNVIKVCIRFLPYTCKCTLNEEIQRKQKFSVKQPPPQAVEAT